jgi:phytoene dehydrogenase-like protein
VSTRYDAVIVGGGHNGLVAAAYLAKAGRKVLVLERRPVLGGAAVTEEVFPGFKFTVCSYVVSLLRPQIVRDLALAKHGLSLIPLECSYTPALDGPGLCRWADPALTREEIGRYSWKDAERYPEFGRIMSRLARFAKPFVDDVAPEPTSLDPRDLLQIGNLAQQWRALDPELASWMWRLSTASAADLLAGWFESDVLRAPMACSGIIGTMLGVRSPGTAYVLLHHYMGEIDGASRAWAFARGGNGAVSEAIASAARSHGAEIRTGTGISAIRVGNGVADGVVLANGDEIAARTVVSSLEPRLTFLKMVGEKHLPADVAAALRNYKCRGSSGKINLALDSFPEFAFRPGTGLHVRGDVAIAPSTDYLERAYDDAKAGTFSRRPYINLVFPSLLDPGMAPPGQHVASLFVQYAPYELADGPAAWPSHREAFADAAIDTLAEYCPGIKEKILHRQVLSPWDLEQEFGLTEGNIFHGELSLDQLLFQRPTAGWARYRTPVRGLWLAGSGAHPGGGVMGAPGWRCAREMLKVGAV